MEDLIVTSRRLAEQKGSSELNLDQLVLELEDRIHQTIIKLSQNQDFQTGWFNGEPFSDEEIEALSDVWMRKEIKFINLVLEKVISWCSDDENQVVLFDVDKTLSDVSNSIWVLRPAVEILLKLIKTIFPEVTLGIMTNNPQEALDGFFNGSDRFGYSLVEISSYFDKDWLFGIRSWYDEVARKYMYDESDKRIRLDNLRAKTQKGVHLVDDYDYVDEQSLCLEESNFDLELYAYGDE